MLSKGVSKANHSKGFFLYQQKRYKGMVISRSRGGGIKKIAYENHFAKKKLLCWKINLPKPHSKGKYEN